MDRLAHMAVAFNRDAIRNLMAAAVEASLDDEEMLLAFMDADERRRYIKMNKEARHRYRHAPLPPELRRILDEGREQMIDCMPNVAP